MDEPESGWKAEQQSLEHTAGQVKIRRSAQSFSVSNEGQRVQQESKACRGKSQAVLPEKFIRDFYGRFHVPVDRCESGWVCRGAALTTDSITSGGSASGHGTYLPGATRAAEGD